MGEVVGRGEGREALGPGLGPIIGPSGNFSSLPDAAKWLLGLAMLLGRLELMTVLVLFTAAYWRT